MLVRQRSSMRTRERLRDREAEAGALAGAGRTACETVEQAADELRSDSRASILDRDPQLVVSLLRRDDDRRRGGAPCRAASDNGWATIRRTASSSRTA